MVQYDNIYDEIRETLLNSRSQAYSAVNFALVQAYWHIGRIIVEHEQDGQERAAYGKAVLQALSVRLTEEFGKGFSVRTLQQMKQFYLTFPNTNALRSQLTWTHYRLLLKLEDDKARQWYMNGGAYTDGGLSSVLNDDRNKLLDVDYFVSDLNIYHLFLLLKFCSHHFLNS